MSTKNRKYGPRRDYTEEDVIRIKAENKRKLDEIYARENWMEWLGRKYYGENYLKTFPDDHYQKTEYRKQVNNGEIKTVNMSDEVEYRYYKRPIIEIDKDGNETEYQSVMEWCDTHNKKKTAAYKIITMMEGRHDRDTIYTKTFKWKE